MSNEYDINIKMNYFMSGTSYEQSLEDLKKFKDEVDRHLGYWEDTCIDEVSFNEEWNKIYGEDKEDFRTPCISTWEEMHDSLSFPENKRRNSYE